MYLKDIPKKVSNKRIAFIVDDYFIGDASGVFTFIKHFAKMCKKLGYVLDLIVDAHYGIDLQDDTDFGNISYFHSTLPVIIENPIKRTILSETILRPKLFLNSFIKYLDYHKPVLVVSHSLSSTLAHNTMIKVINKFHAQSIAYTHVGDILDPDNIEMLDFNNEVTNYYVNLLDNISFDIGTQTSASYSALKRLISKNNILLLPEPFYGSYSPEVSDKSEGILIISTNYNRKRYDLMFEILSKLNYPVTVVTGKHNGHRDKTIEQLASDNGFTNYIKITEIPNNQIPGIIKRHRLLLHLSEIEVLPYSILEASQYIPCIVNKKAKYAQSLPCPVVKLDVDNIEECLAYITHVYENPNLYKKFDVQDYIEEFEKVWIDFLDQGETTGV